MRYVTRKMRFPLLLAVCAASLAPHAAASVISIEPATLTVSPGETFDLSVSVTGAADLYGFQFDIGFTPGTLAAADVTEGSFLTGSGATAFATSLIPGVIDNSAGDISFIADTLQSTVPGRNGNGVLVSIGFTALKAGTSPIDITNVVLLNSSLSAIAVAAAPGTVDVAAVPEPGTLALALTGLAVAGLLRSRHIDRH